MESECFFLGKGGWLIEVYLSISGLGGFGEGFFDFLTEVESGVVIDCGVLVGDGPAGGGVGGDLIIILLKFTGKFAKIRIILIKLITISDNFADISVELGGRGVDSSFEVLLDRLQVHRLLNNIQVVGDVEGDRVHGLLERPGGFMVFEQM